MKYDELTPEELRSPTEEELKAWEAEQDALTDEEYLAEWGAANLLQRVVERELERLGIPNATDRYQFPDNDRSEGYAAMGMFFCSLDVNHFEEEVRALDSWPMASLIGAAKSTALIYMQTKRPAIYKRYLRKLDK